MSLQSLWQLYREGGDAAFLVAQPGSAQERFYLALFAFGQNDFTRAAEFTQKAARLDPKNRVFPQAATYLKRVCDQGKAGVYITGEAFAAFIRGGGNVALYKAINQALHTLYQSFPSVTVLDVGVGDGMALLPALTDNITRLDILEPSESMLAQTAAVLARRQKPYHAHHATIQQFIATHDQQWDLIQATWSLQSIPPAERPAVFRWAKQHGQRLLIAEFEVPGFTGLYEPERVEYILDRYEYGVAEYEGDLVSQGFLMPVLFGYFDRTAAHTNWEGPIQGWVDDLRAAGFTTIQTRLLSPYWWADSYLIDAR
jgi:ubiquinone/menaquinone biosynthesis C-methylase UbiE